MMGRTLAANASAASLRALMEDLAGYGEARATELDAAALGGGKGGLGSLREARVRRRRRGCGR
jgi:hypothetical protein